MPDDKDTKLEEEEVVEEKPEEIVSLVAEVADDEVEFRELTQDEQDEVNKNVFYVRSSQGISINGVGFCRGRYEIGQLVGIMTIDKEIRNNILSLDAESIRINPHLAM